MKNEKELKLNNINLSKNIKDYILSAIDIIEGEVGDDNLVSVLLFGSLTMKGKICGVSDVDIIFVLDDKLSRKKIKYLDNLILQKEISFGIRKEVTTIHDGFIYLIQNITGMFISHFICKKSDFNKGKFNKIFGVNLILSKLLAPTNIVLNNIVQNSVTIYGKKISNNIQLNHPLKKDIIKSMIMNFLLSIGAIAIFISPEATKFSLESVKWSMQSSFFYLKRTQENISNLTIFFKENGVSSPFLDQFITLRHNYTQDLKFIFKTPIIIFQIHLFALQN